MQREQGPVSCSTFRASFSAWFLAEQCIGSCFGLDCVQYEWHVLLLPAEQGYRHAQSSTSILLLECTYVGVYHNKRFTSADGPINRVWRHSTLRVYTFQEAVSLPERTGTVIPLQPEIDFKSSWCSH